MAKNITQTKRTDVIATLEEPMVTMIIEGIESNPLGWNAPPAAPSLVNDTKSQHCADIDYKLAINELIVTHLTVKEIQHFGK